MNHGETVAFGIYQFPLKHIRRMQLSGASGGVPLSMTIEMVDGTVLKDKCSNEKSNELWDKFHEVTR